MPEIVIKERVLEQYKQMLEFSIKHEIEYASLFCGEVLDNEIIIDKLNPPEAIRITTEELFDEDIRAYDETYELISLSNRCKFTSKYFQRIKDKKVIGLAQVHLGSLIPSVSDIIFCGLNGLYLQMICDKEGEFALYQFPPEFYSVLDQENPEVYISKWLNECGYERFILYKGNLLNF